MPVCHHCQTYISEDTLQRMIDREVEAEIHGIRSKLFLAKESMDLKIICKGKTFECHKNVLICQSDVFETMFLNMKMDEAKSGQVKIKDITGKLFINVDLVRTYFYYFLVM